MNLTILGSDTFVPIPGGWSTSSFLVEKGASKILLDMGSGSLRALADAGISYQEITHIFISHTHSDHVGDLLNYIQVQIIFGTQVSHVYLPKGCKDTVLQAFELLNGFSCLEYDLIKFHEYEEGDVCSLEDLSVSSLQVRHSKDIPCFGFRLDSDEKSLGYTGDTEYFDELCDFFDGVDVLVAECNNLDEEVSPAAHMNILDIKKLARNTQIGILLLSHISAKYIKDPVALGTIGGDIRYAENGAKIQL